MFCYTRTAQLFGCLAGDSVDNVRMARIAAWQEHAWLGGRPSFLAAFCLMAMNTSNQCLLHRTQAW
jgi:hypothetical protein